MSFLSPQDIARRLDAELEPQERILWQGSPLPTMFPMPSLALVLFGIPWTAFALFWITMATVGTIASGGGGLFFIFPLFGIPFVVIGIGMLSSPFWMRAINRRMVYAVTSKRVLIANGLFKFKLQTYQPSELKKMVRKEKKDGSGDLIFEEKVQHGSNGQTSVQAIGFMNIRNVRDVDRLIRTLAEG